MSLDEVQHVKKGDTLVLRTGERVKFVEWFPDSPGTLITQAGKEPMHITHHQIDKIEAGE